MIHPRPEAISAVIITLNEEAHIEQCVKSVQWADEVLVVDAESRDRTVEIARNMGARVLVNPWKGFVHQRCFAMDQAKHDWILFVDADETVTDKLSASVRDHAGKERFNGYRVHRLNHFLSKPVYHGGWADDFILRCFDRRKASLPDVDIHEGVDVQGPVGILEGDLLHHSYNSLSEYLEKMNHYTSLEVTDKRERMKDKRVSWVDCILHAWSRFHRMYVVKKGFMDGLTGFMISILSAFYLFVLYAKIWEAQRQGIRKPGSDC